MLPPSDRTIVGAMSSVKDAVDSVAGRIGFAGAVRVDGTHEEDLAAAYGFADRAHQVPNTLDTQFATASGTKSFTAPAVMGLVETGTLGLDTTARSLLGDDLPLIADDVTVEHLLAHRSGIGDYLDEDLIERITEYVLPVPAHTLTSTESFLPLLDGHPMVFPAGARFSTATAATSCSPWSPNARPG
jgi:CubicO group peptidase (beta-lactamase class C family)